MKHIFTVNKDFSGLEHCWRNSGWCKHTSLQNVKHGPSPFWTFGCGIVAYCTFEITRVPEALYHGTIHIKNNLSLDSKLLVVLDFLFLCDYNWNLSWRTWSLSDILWFVITGTPVHCILKVFNKVLSSYKQSAVSLQTPLQLQFF